MEKMKIIAVCACGAQFYAGEVHLINCHITERSGKAHKWTFVEDLLIIYEPKCGKKK